MAMKGEKLNAFLKENRFLLLAAALALFLLLLPTGTDSTGTGGTEYSDEEEKLSEVLSEVHGVGSCYVLLHTSGKNEVSGALVVCEGATSAEVCLAVKKAVTAYTGLGSDRIVILQSKQGGK